MIANAAVAVAKPFLKSTLRTACLRLNLMTNSTIASIEQYDNIMNVNAKGVWNCYKAVAVQMIAEGRGGQIIGASYVHCLEQHFRLRLTLVKFYQRS